MSWSVTADVREFEEAVESFRKRVPLPDPVYRELTTRERGNAFWVASLTELSEVRAVMKELDKAIAQGLPLDQFQKNVEKALGPHRLGGAHVETVLRNAAQTAYSAGRWEQMTSPEATAVRPFWAYDAVLDQRTTEEICRPLDGVIKAHDDPFWLGHVPPLHHRCRSTLRALRRREVERRGGVTVGEPEHEVQQGFGVAPPLRSHDPMLKRGEVAPDVLQVFDEKVAAAEAEAARLAAEAAAAERARLAAEEARRERLKRQDPDYWRATYEPAYGPVAADAVAWGRAMEERGRALMLDEVTETVAELNAQGLYARKSVYGPDAEVLKFFATHPDDAVRLAETFGEKLDAHEAYLDAKDARGEPVTLDRLRLFQGRAMAGLSGQVHSIERRRKALPYPKLQFVEPPKVADKTRKVLQRSYDASLNVYRELGDAKLVHPSDLTIAYQRGRRASYDHEARIVWLGVDASEYPHEIAHVLEAANPELAERARAFLAARTAGETAEKLSVLKNDPRYEDDEIAKPDRFMNEYIGRIYTDGSTEVTTVGVEYIAQGRAAEIVRDDPEHFYFLLGQLRGRLGARP